MTTKILKISKPAFCPWNKRQVTYGLPGSARDPNHEPCLLLSNNKTVYYCLCLEDDFPEECPLETYEEGEQ